MSSFDINPPLYQVGKTPIIRCYTSPFKQLQFAWNDITNIERKYYYSGAFPTAGPPRDMLIKTTSGNSLKVFYFLINSETMDTEVGIKEFEAEIRKHTSLFFD
jgi:hypothetical protein